MNGDIKEAIAFMGDGLMEKLKTTYFKSSAPSQKKRAELRKKRKKK